MIDAIEEIHKRGIIHRDIKPDNFILGRDDCKKVYAIDFGLASCSKWKRYKKEGNRPCGTSRYASINCHKGFNQTARDDVEAIGYVIVFLLKGRLPWQGLKCNPKKRWSVIGDKKASTKPEELCEGIPKSLKNGLISYLNYCRSLKYDEEPDYQLLRWMVREG